MITSGRRAEVDAPRGKVARRDLPDLSRPPLHTLPFDRLLAGLDAFANLVAVRDPDSATGWTTEVGPLPGWAEVLEW